MPAVYRITKLLHDVSRDRSLAERLSANPEEVFKEYHVSGEEADAIRQRQLRKLYEWGVSPYVLLKGALALGIDFPEYMRIMNQPQ
jgi:hypothetical protein